EVLDRDAVGIHRRDAARVAVAHAVEPGRELRWRNPQRPRQLALGVDCWMHAVEPRKLVAQVRNMHVAAGEPGIELALVRRLVVPGRHRLSPMHAQDYRQHASRCAKVIRCERAGRELIRTDLNSGAAQRAGSMRAGTRIGRGEAAGGGVSGGTPRRTGRVSTARKWAWRSSCASCNRRRTTGSVEKRWNVLPIESLPFVVDGPAFGAPPRAAPANRSERLRTVC